MRPVAVTATHPGTPAHKISKPAKETLGSSLRGVARRVHFLAGFVIGPFVVLLCLTGLVYVFSPQIHDDLYRSHLYVTEVRGEPKPVSTQVRAALEAHPEATLRSVLPPPAPDRTTQVVLDVPGLRGTADTTDTADTGAGVTARTVYVDPYTNYLNGELNTVDDRLPANTWLREFHNSMHLGDVGRLYAELSASWLPVVTLGGVVLWLGGKRRWRELLVPSAKSKSARMRLRGVKGPLGLWLTVGLLIISITGLTMSQWTGGREDARVHPLDARAPTLTAAPVDIPPGVRPIGVDQALAVAAKHGLTGELRVTLPSAADRPLTIAERAEGLPMQRDAIAVDPYTAKVTEYLAWGDWPFLAQVASLGAQLHLGTLFGLANQILLALLAIGTIVLIWLSYRMAWKRSPYRRKWAPMPPPVWRQLLRGQLAAGVLAVAGLTWLTPVFGASLVSFVLLDGALVTTKRGTLALRRDITLWRKPSPYPRSRFLRRPRRVPPKTRPGKPP